MALDRLTKVDGGGISTISDYRVGIITATKFVGPVEGTITSTDANFSGNVTIGGTLTYEDVTNIDSVGIITAQSDVHVGGGVSAVGVGTFSGLDISGDIDVDGHTNLDNVSIAGVTTFVGNIDANGDIDVDGHTNLDNVSIAGVSTFSDDIFIPDDKNIKFGNTFASPDLEIFHNSSVDYNEIKNNTGVLRIRNHDTDPANKYIYIQSERIQLRSHTNNHSMISAFAGAQVELYHNNVKRLETSSVGVSIPQDLDVDGHTNLDNVSVAGVTTFTGNANFGSNGSITSAANFTLSSNKLRVTGSDTVGIECQRASNATIQCTETTNNTDLQLRANSAGGLVRTATNKALNLGTNQKNRIQITNDGKVQIGLPGNSTSLPAGTEVVNIRAMTDGNLHIRAIGNIASSPTGTGVGIDVLNDASNAVKDLALRGSTVIFRSATAETLRISGSGGHRLKCNESYFAGNLSECNTTQLALNINQTRGGVTKGIAFGAIGSSSNHTAIQCYDTSNNGANPLLLNPFGGNIGIGYDSPRTILEINATHNETANTLTPVLRLSTGNSYGGNNTGSALEFGTTNTNYPTWVKGRIGAVYNGSSSYGGHLVFHTNSGSSPVSANSERMRITDAGNVGINEDSPNAKLDVRGTALISDDIGSVIPNTFPASNVQLMVYTSTTGQPISKDNCARLLIATDAKQTGAQGYHGCLDFGSSDCSAANGAAEFNYRTAAIMCRGDGDTSPSVADGDLQFYTKQASGSLTHRFDIAPDGTLTGTDTDGIGSLSDQRLKTNIQDYSYDLNKFKQLKTRTFDWINPEFHREGNQRGFIAQEVETVDPYWNYQFEVSKENAEKDYDLLPDGDENYTVRDHRPGKASKLNGKDAMYVSVIQQLISKIETLEVEVAALKGS